MRRESLTWLWDARRAAMRVRDFVSGHSRADYDSDVMLRSAVERQLGIVGEALNRLSQIDPDTAAEVPEVRRIVGLRNVLIHAYAAVDDDVVWAIATARLPSLIQLLEALLDSGESADE